MASQPPYDPILTAQLSRVAASDEQAFAELFRCWYLKIYDAGILLTRSHEAAEELVKDVFMKVWLKSESLIGIQNFWGYLFSMARNQFLSGLERKAKLKKITT